MDLNVEKATMSLLQLLHNLFKKTLTGMPLIVKAEDEGKKHIISLANLLNQRQSVQTAWEKAESPLLPDFPDLQAKVNVKISSEIDSKVDILKDSITHLKEHHEHVNRARTEMLRLLERQGDQLDQMALHQGSAIVPPIQVMLDWVDDLELELRELYYSRLHYLESIPQLDWATIENLPNLWMQQSKLINTLYDCAEQTKYFLEDFK